MTYPLPISLLTLRTRATLAAGLIAIGWASPALQAQQPGAQPDTAHTSHSQTQAPFFTEKDALLAIGFAAATAVMFPLDRQVARELRDSSAQANQFFRHAATGFELIASPGAFYIGGGLYIAGRLGKWDRVADLGWHGTEAVLFAEGITYFIKGAVGRGRPFLSNGEDPSDYHPGKGFTAADWTSFPSGHTTTAFAAAAAVTNETTRWWPHSTYIIGPIMYAGATMVGLSRMYHSKHWASDVALGAAIGTFSGRKVVQYVHGHPHNFIDRVMLRTSVAPDGHGGAMLAVSLPEPW